MRFSKYVRNSQKFVGKVSSTEKSSVLSGMRGRGTCEVSEFYIAGIPEIRLSHPPAHEQAPTEGSRLPLRLVPSLLSVPHNGD